jgi:septal ring factor EnvC (AmiA/AmiB activator)
LSPDKTGPGAAATDFLPHGSGKSDDLAALKQALDRVRQDLGHKQVIIAELRQERHRLANQAMRAMALERKLAEVTNERDRLRAEGEAMRKGLIASGEDVARRKRESDAQIARMALELNALREQNHPPASIASGDSDIRAALAQISATLERLTTQLVTEPSRSAPARQIGRPGAANDPAIDISFED